MSGINPPLTEDTLPTVARTIDRIADDLNLRAGLPPHKTWRYSDPRALRLDDHPHVLAVYPRRVIAKLLGTPSSFENMHAIAINWIRPNFIGGELNVGEEAVALTELQRAEAIAAICRGYAEEIPGLFNTTGVLSEIEYGTTKNGAWVMDLELRVQVFE